ncbi:MAG TPA: BadF/BadG/BcrA/BcrD ATPase family protein, partial [Clostridia bacterium]
LIARKFDRRDILAGIHISMARRITKMIRKSEVMGEFVMTGGGALNTGLHRAFEDELLSDVHIVEYPQFNGAIGAAILAMERAGKQ